jgi:dTDP-4-amino-4,6-dideoxygalactose transaminase
MIPFNKPYFSGNETRYIEDAVRSGKISGNGFFTQKCHEFFLKRFGFQKVLLTTSCTHALEMAALLLDIQPGDEVIIPSYTFVSTANAFILRGAKVIFADSSIDNPNLDTEKIESLITSKTKAIVPIHYSGIACDMDPVLTISGKYNLSVVEDAAMAIDSFYKGKPLGSFGSFSAFSFHETKNIISGEGGMLIINNHDFNRRAEVIWEKGTNRVEFFRGEVNKYGWVDIGSSYIPSEIIAAFLMAQLESMDRIQMRRKTIWNLYFAGLKQLEIKGLIKLPVIPDYATNNASLFYMICNSLDERTKLIEHLKKNNILSVFHYLPLHRSRFYENKHDGRSLPFADFYSDCLLRLPLYYELTDNQVDYILNKIIEFYA